MQSARYNNNITKLSNRNLLEGRTSLVKNIFDAMYLCFVPLNDASYLHRKTDEDGPMEFIQ